MEAKSKICRADVAVQLWRPSGCCRTRKSRWPSSTYQAGEFSLTRGRVSFLFYLDIQLIGRGPPTLGRAICFIHSTYLNVIFIQKHPHRNIQNKFDQMSGHPVTQSSWHIKLTIAGPFSPVMLPCPTPAASCNSQWPLTYRLKPFL